MLPVLRAEEAILGAQVASTGKVLKMNRWTLQRWQNDAMGPRDGEPAAGLPDGIKRKVVKRKSGGR